MVLYIAQEIIDASAKVPDKQPVIHANCRQPAGDLVQNPPQFDMLVFKALDLRRQGRPALAYRDQIALALLECHVFYHVRPKMLKYSARV